MDILAGVGVFPFQPTLIAKDGPAFVRIDTRGHPGNRGYEKSTSVRLTRPSSPICAETGWTASHSGSRQRQGR